MSTDRIFILDTPRLSLRAWREQDWPDFASINADPEVMKYYPATLNYDESNELATKITRRMSEQGWGFWAAELKNTAQFMGFVGLNNPTYSLPVSPCMEIGWRLARPYWGLGYATEAARAALQFGFNQLNVDKIYAFASVANTRSINVMLRLGMTDTHKNFEHPIIPAGHTLSEHVLYKITSSIK